MALVTEIRKRIKRLTKGKSFGYDDLRIAKDDYIAGAKAQEQINEQIRRKHQAALDLAD